MFKITIEETKTVREIRGKEWVVVATREVPRESQYYQAKKDEPQTRIEEVRGYSPEIEKEVEVTNTILVQEVDTLDLASVIKAINNL